MKELKDKERELQEKYVELFKITFPNGWLKAYSKKAIFNKHPAVEGPSFLDYEIEKEGHHNNATLENRSRTVWLKDSNGKGFMQVIYLNGQGIVQVSECGKYIYFTNLDSAQKRMIQKWLKRIDNYVFKKMPDLKTFLETYHKE